MKKSLPLEIIYLLIILATTFFFRFYHFASFSLSNDELSAINRLNFNSLSEVIQLGVRPDGHPAGAQMLLYFWTHLFGLTPASIRFPFVFISALAPLFGYLFLRKITGPSPALFFATSLAFLSFPQLYGQIARPYGIGLTFSLMAAFFWAKILLDYPKKKIQIILITTGISLSWALCIYTHYFAALTAVVMGISGLFFLKKSNYVAYLSASIATVLLFLPHLKITLHQISLGGVGSWLAKPDGLWLWHHILFIFNGSQYLFIFTITLIIVLILIQQKQKFPILKLQITLFLWFLIPFLTGFFYSIYVNPVLQNSVLIFSMPFFLAFVFSFVPPRLTSTNKLTITVLSLIIILHTFFFNSYYKQQHFAEFEQVPQVLNKWQKENPHQRILNLVQINHPDYLNYYLKQQNIKLDFLGRSFKSLEDMEALQNIIDTTTADYITFSDIQNGANHIALSLIESSFPSIKRSKFFGNKTDMYLLGTRQKKPKEDTLKTFPSEAEFMAGEEFVLNKNPHEKTQLLDIHAYYEIKIPTILTGASIVYDIQNQAGKSLLWHAVPLHFIIKDSIWQTAVLHDRIILQENYYKIKIYIWNPKKEEIWVGRKMIKSASINY